jgi:hypothetical protein
MITCVVEDVREKLKMEMEMIMEMQEIVLLQLDHQRREEEVGKVLIRSLNVHMKVVEEVILEQNIYIDIN